MRQIGCQATTSGLIDIGLSEKRSPGKDTVCKHSCWRVVQCHRRCWHISCRLLLSLAAPRTPISVNLRCCHFLRKSHRQRCRKREQIRNLTSQ